MQIFADVFGLPVLSNEVDGAAGVGAAICAVAAAGIYPSFESAAANMVRFRDCFTPIPEHTGIYDRMRPIYSDITGCTDQLLKRTYEIFE